MPKVTAPCLSLQADGTLGDTMTYSRRKGENIVRVHVVPANPQTDGQVAVRNLFSDTVALYHDPLLLAADKIGYNVKAHHRAPHLSGYNLFFQIYHPILEAESTPILCQITECSISGTTVTVTGTASVETKDIILNAYSSSGTLLGSKDSSISGEKAISVSWTSFPGKKGSYIEIIEDAQKPRSETGWYEVVEGV